jgi:hypothetical protein
MKKHKDDITKIVEQSSEMTKRTIRREGIGDLKTDIGWSRTKHLDSIMEDAQKLRGRIVNPNLGLRIFSEEEKSTWFFQGFDWRLAPFYWFSVVAPLLEFADRWIPNFENLKLHLADSDFLKDYKHLKDDTISLASDIDKFADSQKEGNHSWYEKWEKFNDYLDIFFIDGRQFKPDTIPSHDVVKQLIYDLSDLGNFFNETEDKLKEYYPDLEKKCEKIEILLQHVYDDLDKNKIALDIKKGKCPQCPNKKL